MKHKIAKSDTVYQGYFDVKVDLLESIDGPSMIYTSIDIKVHAAAILARTPDGKFLITKEYRHPTRQWILGCPGGRIDPGESPAETAVRELKEETGFVGSHLIPLGQVFSLPAVTDQIIHYFFIDEAMPTHKTAHEPFEAIQIDLKTEAELVQEILSGTAIDGVLCSAFFLYKSKLS